MRQNIKEAQMCSQWLWSLQDRQKGSRPASASPVSSQPHQDWVWPHSVEDALKLLQGPDADGVRAVAGNTGPGVFKDWPGQTVTCIDLKAIVQLRTVRCSQVRPRGWIHASIVQVIGPGLCL